MMSYANDIMTQDKSYKYRVWGRSSLVHSWHLVQKVRIFCPMTPQVGKQVFKEVIGRILRIFLFLLLKEGIVIIYFNTHCRV